MTIEQLYNEASELPPDERRELAEIILSDLQPEPPNSIRSKKRLEELLLEGLNSGPGIEATPEYWAQKEQLVRERLGPA